MLSVSMKTLFSPYLSPSSYCLPKPQPFPRFSLTSESVLRKFEALRNSCFTLKGLAIGSSRSLCLAVSSREIQTKASWSSTSSTSGEIHVIVGPMFAGKTTTLLRRVLAEGKNGRRVAIIKSDKDTRFGLESIVTHDGEKLPCWAVSNLSSFRQKFGLDAYDQLDVIGVDEAQFFGDLYDFCREAADEDGKTIIVAGLDGDYLRRRFGWVLDIIPLADSVTKLTAWCEVCGKRALFTLRKTEETEREVIGGAEVYMPVCRQHYVSGQGVIQRARVILESQNAECASYS